MKIFYFLILLILFSCKKENSFDHNTNLNFKKAIVYRESKDYDSAFYYYNLAKNDFIEINDSIGSAKSLINMAMIQTNKGDFLGGIESSLEANKFLKKKNDSTVRSLLGKSYNNMAISFNYLKNFDSAYSFYKKALKFVEKEEDKYVCYNNIGDVLLSQGKIKSAKKFFEKAILADSSYNYSRALNNLAKVKYLDNKDYNPLPELYQALKIREETKDSSGLNSSFETLSTYYLDKDKNLSLHFAKMMLETATNNKSADDQLLALQRIIPLEPQNYLENFEKFVSINEGLQTVRNQKKNQFAMVRYDVEQSRSEVLSSKNKIQRQYFLLALLILAIIIILVWYRRRHLRLKQEKELEVKNTQLKLSKKVHDVVANGIYQVMTKIENQDQIDKDKMLDELEFVYEKSRDISYDKEDFSNENPDFSEKISELIASFKNGSIETYVVGNEKDTWTGLKQTSGDEVYQIIRELLVNMKKHSQASRVVFKFERNNRNIKIQYHDNGVGIPGDMIYKNGLTNTGNRIEAINGEIIFDTKTEKGLKVNISFPVS